VRVLGIDPGTLATGFGVVDRHGRHCKYIAHGVIRTRSKDPLWVRLQEIRDGLQEVLRAYHPESLSLERCFVSKNVQSALKLGHTRGVIMVTCVEYGLDVFEYTPGQIKLAVAGHGHAQKNQVQEMVRVQLGMEKIVAEDAADALAGAMCHLHAHAVTHRLEAS
jgi:crossover junction endodeoxyribonuclease RuvC